MKTLIKFIFLTSILLSSFQNIYSQFPSYTLEVKNYFFVNSSTLTLDIVLTHTNANTFAYATGQYVLRIPESFATLGVGSGENSGYQYDSAFGTLVTDFPPLPAFQFIPRNPSVVEVTVNGIPSYELRLSANALPGPGNGFIIQQNNPFLIIRMKIKSTTPINLKNGNFTIRDSCSDNPLSPVRTRINAYIGTNSTEITRCVNHFVHPIFPPPTTTCNLKLAIEGLYNSQSDKLVKKDTVTVYLRRTSSPYQIIHTSTAIIDSLTLSGNFNFLHSAPAFYYIVVKHRNSLETWSRNGGEFFVGPGISYDFTSSQSQAYGNNMVLKGSRYCIYSGDVNQDLIIDLSDMSQVDNEVFNYAMGYNPADLNGDNFVDQSDYEIVDNNRLKQAKAPLYGNLINVQ